MKKLIALVSAIALSMVIGNSAFADEIRMKQARHLISQSEKSCSAHCAKKCNKSKHHHKCHKHHSHVQAA